MLLLTVMQCVYNNIRGSKAPYAAAVIKTSSISGDDYYMCTILRHDFADSQLIVDKVLLFKIISAGGALYFGTRIYTRNNQ